MRKRLTLGSLFDGIGGFPLAAQRCGIKTLWASEIEAACVSITKRHFPHVQHLGDITQIHGGEIPPVDIISFGSPCQDLSVAGGQKGLRGERSGLFLHAVRIIQEMRLATNGKYPTFIIWENVPGAFNSSGGADFRAVIETLTKTRFSMPTSGRWARSGVAGAGRGGANIAWRQFDSQYWGIPQRRKRIFLVGDFRGTRAAEILFKQDSLLGYVEKSGTQGENIAAAFGNLLNASGGEVVIDFGRTGDRVRINAQKSATISTASGGGGSATGLYLLPEAILTAYCIQATTIDRQDQNGANGKGINEDVAYTLNTIDRHAVCVVYPASDRHGITACFAPNGYGGYKEGVGTLRASAGKHGHSSSNIIIEIAGTELELNYTVRRLTPLECERLQGFPDYWTNYTDTGGILADTPRYTALGNSLAVPCAERVFRGILSAVRGRDNV